MPKMREVTNQEIDSVIDKLFEVTQEAHGIQRRMEVGAGRSVTRPSDYGRTLVSSCSTLQQLASSLLTQAALHEQQQEQRQRIRRQQQGQGQINNNP